MVDRMAIAGTALQFGLNGILYASTSEVTKQLWDKFWRIISHFAAKMRSPPRG